MSDIFRGIKDKLDFRLNARNDYVSRVVSKNRVLDIGGRNRFSESRRRINQLNKNPNSVVTSTDIIPEYGPDLVDDICNTAIAPNSFDGVYCDAVLEHVTEYWKAVDNIHSILADGGEAFIYVPFCYPFHDRMDYHRFTFTEVARMLERFSEVKILAPGKESGYGYVFWSMVSLTQISRFPQVHKVLALTLNGLLKIGLWIVYKLKLRSMPNTFEEVSFYWIYLYVNHGFAAWVRK